MVLSISFRGGAEFSLAFDLCIVGFQIHVLTCFKCNIYCLYFDDPVCQVPILLRILISHTRLEFVAY